MFAAKGGGRTHTSGPRFCVAGSSGSENPDRMEERMERDRHPADAGNAPAFADGAVRTPPYGGLSAVSEVAQAPGLRIKTRRR
ncbi:hypothetical protein SAMN04489764_5280 [Thermostaphylospora chromogena]|uniref:Uncharacterized protein n=1 Tax=Thermostaphylospora chromogena TaxID=35622 RepID=A0A1H1I6Q4_9ACTN|nr:hypothetical protein SAMN04489764_5280 [Thermostaphylospora chromogena]